MNDRDSGQIVAGADDGEDRGLDMSDGGDDGSGDDSYGTGGPTRGGSGSLPSLDVIRRAMRWETLVILLILVILAAVAS